MASGHLDNISHLFPVKQLFFRWTSNANFLFWWCFSCLSRDLEKPRSVDEVLIASLCNNMEEFQPETSQNLKKKTGVTWTLQNEKFPFPLGGNASSTVESADATSFDSTLGLSSAGSEAPVASRAETGRASFGWVALGRPSRGPKLMAFFRLCIKRWS